MKLQEWFERNDNLSEILVTKAQYRQYQSLFPKEIFPPMYPHVELTFNGVPLVIDN